MQHLAGVGAGGDQRVVAAHAGVAEPSTLLLAAEHLADERIDIDDRALACRAGACSPRAGERVAQDAVKLADMPEREGTQERPERRWRRNCVAEDLTGSAGAQQIAVVDAVRAQRHRRDQRHHLRARIRRARPVAEVDCLINECLDPEPISKRRDQHDPRVGDRSLIVELDPNAVQSDRPVSMHHEGDLLLQPPDAGYVRKSAAEEVFFVHQRTESTRRIGGSRLSGASHRHSPSSAMGIRPGGTWRRHDHAPTEAVGVMPTRRQSVATE
jgi:hypothetical protein